MSKNGTSGINLVVDERDDPNRATSWIEFYLQRQAFRKHLQALIDGTARTPSAVELVRVFVENTSEDAAQTAGQKWDLRPLAVEVVDTVGLSVECLEESLEPGVLARLFAFGKELRGAADPFWATAGLRLAVRIAGKGKQTTQMMVDVDAAAAELREWCGRTEGNELLKAKVLVEIGKWSLLNGKRFDEFEMAEQLLRDVVEAQKRLPLVDMDVLAGLKAVNDGHKETVMWDESVLQELVKDTCGNADLPMAHRERLEVHDARVAALNTFHVWYHGKLAPLRNSLRAHSPSSIVWLASVVPKTPRAQEIMAKLAMACLVHAAPSDEEVVALKEAVPALQVPVVDECMSPPHTKRQNTGCAFNFGTQIDRTLMPEAIKAVLGMAAEDNSPNLDSATLVTVTSIACGVLCAPSRGKQVPPFSLSGGVRALGDTAVVASQCVEAKCSFDRGKLVEFVKKAAGRIVADQLDASPDCVHAKWLGVIGDCWLSQNNPRRALAAYLRGVAMATNYFVDIPEMDNSLSYYCTTFDRMTECLVQLGLRLHAVVLQQFPPGCADIGRKKCFDLIDAIQLPDLALGKSTLYVQYLFDLPLINKLSQALASCGPSKHKSDILSYTLKRLEMSVGADQETRQESKNNAMLSFLRALFNDFAD